MREFSKILLLLYISAARFRPDGQGRSSAGNWILTRTRTAVDTSSYREDITFYDGLGRTLLVREGIGSSSAALSSWTEKSISYDRNGNLKTLKRYGADNSTPAANLSFAYSGNRRTGYSYDANGNVTLDAENNLQITGNLLNLPSTIRRSGSVKAAITYLADGTRTKTVDASGAGYVYRGSFVYDAGGGVLRDVAFGRAGRFLRSGARTMGDICYFVTDHLGSTRAVVKAGSVVERDDYTGKATAWPLPTKPTVLNNI